MFGVERYLRFDATRLTVQYSERVEEKEQRRGKTSY